MRALGVGLVRLRVRDLGRELDFYRDLLGLAVVREEGSSVWLTASAAERVALSAVEEHGRGGTTASILRLDEDSAAPTRPSRTTGLFHVALRVPDRRALAAVLAHLIGRRGLLLGASDHAVSEALYLQDPEGNGIEIYADRPRSEWRERHGELCMTTEPLDVKGVLAELDREPGTQHPEPSTRHAAPGTRLSRVAVGHIHLQVSDLAPAERFYAGVLGFDVTARGYPGALFMSAGGYHHHVAVNVWSTRGADRPPADSAGLVEFEVAVDGASGEKRVEDPDGHVVVVKGDSTSLPAAGRPAPRA